MEGTGKTPHGHTKRMTPGMAGVESSRAWAKDASRVSSLELLLCIKSHAEITANVTGRLAASCQKVTGKRLIDVKAAQLAIISVLPYYQGAGADKRVPMLFGHP
ncbi:hypothetical protein WJX84_005217 [Apatococcus fuscideae]|uniref:Uncharacterized protein n=1 Tax=Apatococcus fuscideae TaxID=2026836 RepID=A0AAW1RGB2_9CHLO